MKKTLLLLALAVGVASSKADTYNIGDENSFYLGFFAHADVSSSSVLVNLGRNGDVFAGITLDQSALASVLATTYGSNWYNNTDVRWGAFGYNGSYVNGSAGTAFVARSSTLPSLGTGSGGRTSWDEEKYYTFLDNASALFAAHGSDIADKSYVTGSTGHQHQFSVIANGPTAFSGITDSAWNIFTSPAFAPITHNLRVSEYNGTSYELEPSSAPATTVVMKSTNGVLSVPEPSTYALMGVAALILVVVYRRRTA